MDTETSERIHSKESECRVKADYRTASFEVLLVIQFRDRLGHSLYCEL